MVWNPGLSDVPEFTLFNTLIPGSRSVRFCMPPRYRDWGPSMHVDGDRCLGTLNGDGPLVTDPAQAILVVRLVHQEGQTVFIIARIQALIKHACSVNTDSFVPWDEWRRGAVVMVAPSHISRRNSCPFVRGVHVIFVKPSAPQNEHGEYGLHFYLHILDFSRRACGVLPLRDDGDGAERTALFEDGRDFLVQENDQTIEQRLDSLGNGNFMFLVSNFCCWTSGGRLMVW